MSNRPSICWKCVHKEDCKMFNKNPEAKVRACGRFLMKDEDRTIMQAIADVVLDDDRRADMGRQG